MHKDQKHGSPIKTASILGIAVAAAAGAYFLYGTKDGKKKMKQVRGWALKAKGEILEKIEGLKDVNEDTYRAIVDNVAKRYALLKNIDKKDLEKVIGEIHAHWKDIKKHIGTEIKKHAGKKTKKTTPKKTARKVSKKSQD
ncbi:MAG: hypothetical protein PHF79_02625 [Candidatus Pacebacteria bacterium]|nr:hypothetical protein [Candidatus Paceibacterota bacterium]